MINKIGIACCGCTACVSICPQQCIEMKKNEEGFLVASTPITDDEGWKPAELNKVFGLIDGNIIFESEEHENEFIFTKEHEEFILNSVGSLNLEDHYERQ
jgi:Na+-translocating ferredoxin:NAD+ oxidoreductase RNF subunit RnfB